MNCFSWTTLRLSLTVALLLAFVSCGGGGSAGGPGQNNPFLTLSVSPSALNTGPNSAFSVLLTASTNAGSTPSLISIQLPTGISTTAVLPLSIPGAGVTLDFQTSPAIAPGTYTVVLHGQAGSLTKSTNVNATVSNSGALHILRVQPSRAMVGNAIGLVTLAGSGFTNQSTVLFDGVTRPTFVQSDTQLDFEPPDSTWSTAQSHTVQVSDPHNGESNVATYLVYSPTPGPAPFVGQPSLYLSENLVINSLVPDLNGDGRADLIVTTLDSESNLYVPAIRFGQADGTFAAAQPLGSFTLSFTPGMELTGDFDNNGIPDLILFGTTTNNAQALYQVLLNDGTGHFNPTGSGVLPPAAFYLAPAAAGDFDHDGRLDFAYGVSSSFRAVSLFLGNGNGTFDAPIEEGTSGGVTYSMSAVDLNGDGQTDLVYLFIPDSGANQIRELLSASGGGFTDVQIPGLPSPSIGLTVADFNNDHIPDIFAVDTHGRGLAYLGAGDGSFHSSGHPIVASDVYFAAPQFVAGDFDHDGNIDVATRTQLNGPDELMFLFGDGHGAFTSQSIVSDHSFTLLVGDVNGDGIDDIFTSQDAGFSYASVVLGRHDRNFPSAQILLPNAWGDLSAGDVFGDGYTDLLVEGAGDGGFGSVAGSLYHFESNGTFASVGQPPQYATELVDIDGDGLSDMVGFTGTGLLFWKGDGSGVFQAPVAQVSLPRGFHPIVFRDMDGDGHMDIVVPGEILYGSGNFEFTAVPTQFIQNFAVGDFDGDHVPDVATPGGILFGLGGRSFTGPTGSSPLQNDAGPFQTQVVADINGDGVDDLVLGNLIYLSQGRLGLFLDQVLTINGYAAGIGSVAVADFNADGRADIALGLFGGGEDLVLFTNDGTGKYQVNYYASGLMSMTSLAADFSRDGKPDLAFRGYALDFVPPTVTVFLHK